MGAEKKTSIFVQEIDRRAFCDVESISCVLLPRVRNLREERARHRWRWLCLLHSATLFAKLLLLAQPEKDIVSIYVVIGKRDDGYAIQIRCDQQGGAERDYPDPTGGGGRTLTDTFRSYGYISVESTPKRTILSRFISDGCMHIFKADVTAFLTSKPYGQDAERCGDLLCRLLRDRDMVFGIFYDLLRRCETFLDGGGKDTILTEDISRIAYHLSHNGVPLLPAGYRSSLRIMGPHDPYELTSYFAFYSVVSSGSYHGFVEHVMKLIRRYGELLGGTPSIQPQRCSLEAFSVATPWIGSVVPPMGPYATPLLFGHAATSIQTRQRLASQAVVHGAFHAYLGCRRYDSTHAQT